MGFAAFIPFLWLKGTPPLAVRHLTRIWAKGTLALLARIAGIRHAEQGRHHLPAGPCLILANHQSPWETVAALVLFPDIAIIAKRELLRIPVLGWYLRHSPMIIIDRSDAASSARAMLGSCRRALADGRSLLIFPEGTRMPVGSPIVFKRGAELLYRTLGITAVLFAHDAGQFWQPGSVLLPGVIKVSFLPPLAPGLDAAVFLRMSQQMLERELYDQGRRLEGCPIERRLAG